MKNRTSGGHPGEAGEDEGRQDSWAGHRDYGGHPRVQAPVLHQVAPGALAV